jgi:hypothetical protein
LGSGLFSGAAGLFSGATGLFSGTVGGGGITAGSGTAIGASGREYIDLGALSILPTLSTGGVVSTLTGLGISLVLQELKKLINITIIKGRAILFFI